MEQKRMTATEREALMRINLAEMLVRTEASNIENRTKLIPRGAWRLASAQSQLKRYVEDAFQTVPAEQCKSVWRTLQDTSYAVGVRCAATRDIKRDREYGVVVPIGALGVILAACGEHCLMCMGGSEEQHKCKLKKALDTIPNDVIGNDGGGCPYQRELLYDGDDKEAKQE